VLYNYLRRAIAKVHSIGYQVGFKNPNLGPDISYNLYIVIMLCKYIYTTKALYYLILYPMSAFRLSTLTAVCMLVQRYCYEVAVTSPQVDSPNETTKKTRCPYKF